jgi:hypothetical protein
MKLLCQIVLCLIALHGSVGWLRSQTPPPPREMNLIVVEGEGQTNNIGQHVHRPPLVRVEDENHHPIVGAAVIFTLPTEGATGEFGGSKTLTVVTDSQGEAAGKGLKVNQLPGKLPIYVNASYRGVTAKATITEFIVAPPGAKVGGGGNGKLIIVLAIIGGAAAGGAYYATHRGGSSSSSNSTGPTGPTPIGITVGTGTIAGGN